jgi:hypothetical protein
MKRISDYSAAEFKQIIAIKEQIESLQHQLTSVLGDGAQTDEEEPDAPAPAKRKLSAAHRRKLIKALAKARKIRWAKAKADGAVPTPKKRRISPKGRAAIAAGARARWAKFRALEKGADART